MKVDEFSIANRSADMLHFNSKIDFWRLNLEYPIRQSKWSVWTSLFDPNWFSIWNFFLLVQVAIFAIGAQFCWNSFVPEAECSWRHRLAECIPIDLYALFMLVLMQANIAASVACRWAFPRNGLKSRCKSINSIARNPCLNDLKEWKTKCTKIDANFIFMTRMRRQPYHTAWPNYTHTNFHFASITQH